MAERRLSLVLEWLEAHPERYEEVKKKLLGINLQYAKLDKSVKPLIKTTAEEKAKTEAVAEVRAEEALDLFRQHKNLRRVVDVLALYQKKLGMTGKGLEDWSKKLSKAGWRVGFFGWIVAYGARSMLHIFQQLYGAFEKLISVSVDWPSSLEKVYTAMAMLESQGMMTTEMEKLLSDTAERLITQGPVLQALWLGLEAQFISAATIITSKLVPKLRELLSWLTEYLQLESTQRTLAELGVVLFDLIRAMIYALPTIVAVLSAFRGWMPVITALIRTFAPFIPILFVLGTVIWMLGPALQVMGFMLKIAVVYQNLSAVAAGKQVVGYTMAARTAQILRFSLLGLIGALAALAIFTFLSIKGITIDWKKGFSTIDKTVKDSMKKITATFSKSMVTNLAVTTEMMGEMNLAMAENFESMQFVSEDAFFRMATSSDVAVDAFGNVIGTVDKTSGAVYDSSGQIVGNVDWMTGEIRDDSGNIVGYLQGMSGNFENLASDVESYTTQIETSFSDMAKSYETQWNYMNLTTDIMVAAMIAKISPLLGILYFVGIRAYEAYTTTAETSKSATETIETLGQKTGKTREELLALIAAYESEIEIMKEVQYQDAAYRKYLEWLESELAKVKEELTKTCFLHAAADSRVFLTSLEELLPRIAELSEKSLGLRDRLVSMCFVHAARNADLFSSVLQQTNQEVNDTTQRISDLRNEMARGLKGEVELGRGEFLGTSGPQYITVHSPITFEAITLTGIADINAFLDLVQDRTSKGIAEALRQRK